MSSPHCMSVESRVHTRTALNLIVLFGFRLLLLLPVHYKLYEKRPETRTVKCIP